LQAVEAAVKLDLTPRGVCNLSRLNRKGEDMAKKKAGNNQARAVRAAWQRVRQSLKRAEGAMRGVVDANRALMKALGEAGVSMTQNARTELDARIRQLDASRQNARKQLDALTQRLMSLAKRGAAKGKGGPRRGRRR
jgi:chromosome segregation ATPase